MNKNEARYKAFISYSHDDDKWAAWLHRALESYRPPKRLIGEVTEHGPIPNRMAPVFRDRAELSTATDLGKELNEALQQSACQIVICSPKAARSHWVNEEILAFKRLGRESRIFCVIVGGEPNVPEVAITQTGMAVLYLRTDRAAEAYSLSQSAYTSLAEAYGEYHWRAAWALATQGASLARLLRFSEAEPLLLNSYEMLGSATGARAVHVETARQNIVDLYAAWGRPEESARFDAATRSGS